MRIIIGAFLFIFASIIGSVGSILLFKQNALIKYQNEMLLKQYTGFTNQIDSQKLRWDKIDTDSFNSEVVALERDIITLNRDIYTFSFDMAVLELQLFPNTPHEEKISVKVFDLWELTAKTIDKDKIKTKEDLEQAKLIIARFEFFFSPVNQRIQVMRNYPNIQQKEMLDSMKDLLNNLIVQLKGENSNKTNAAGTKSRAAD